MLHPSTHKEKMTSCDSCQHLVSGLPDGFNHHRDKYLVFCFCGKIHSIIAGRILGTIIKISAVCGAYSSRENNDELATTIYLLQVALALCFLLGITYKKSWLAFPFLAWMMLVLSFMIIGVPVLFIIALIPYDENTLKFLVDNLQDPTVTIATDVHKLFFISGIVLLILGLFQYWIVVITHRCYIYLRNYSSFLKAYEYETVAVAPPDGMRYV